MTQAQLRVVARSDPHWQERHLLNAQKARPTSPTTHRQKMAHRWACSFKKKSNA